MGGLQIGSLDPWGERSIVWPSRRIRGGGRQHHLHSALIRREFLVIIQSYLALALSIIARHVSVFAQWKELDCSSSERAYTA